MDSKGLPFADANEMGLKSMFGLVPGLPNLTPNSIRAEVKSRQLFHSEQKRMTCLLKNEVHRDNNLRVIIFRVISFPGNSFRAFKLKLELGNSRFTKNCLSEGNVFMKTNIL